MIATRHTRLVWAWAVEINDALRNLVSAVIGAAWFAITDWNTVVLVGGVP